MAKRINCICCEKRVINYGNNKYCSNCASFIKDLRSKLNHERNQRKYYCKLLYGSKSGSECLSLNVPNEFKGKSSPAVKLAWKQAQLSQRQNDVKEFVEFLEKMPLSQFRADSVLYEDIQQKLAELKQEINNGK